MITISQAMAGKWFPPIGSVIITDLDRCAVDSSHRQHCLPDGTLDLQNWREHSIPSEIKLDKLTPWGLQLAQLVRTRQDIQVLVCTSRVMGDADFEYVKHNFKIGRNSGKIWSRPESCLLADAELKYKLFTENVYKYGDLLLALNLGKLYFLDDLEANCKVAENLGLTAVNIKKGLTAD